MRWKLITGAAIIHAVLMSLFIWDLVVRQKKVLFERQQEHAHALSQTLAVTCAHWLVSYDIAGLQELINAQRIYPELSFALITDINNKILAHTEPDKIGQLVLDMPEYAKNAAIYLLNQMVDVAVPVNLAGTHIGWVRIGIGNVTSNEKLKAIASDGVFYALSAIFIGALISWFIGTKLSSRLHTIQKTVRQIKADGEFSPIELPGNDEAALVAHEFNRMFEKLQRHQQRLKNLNEDLEILVDERTKELQKSVDAIKTKNMELTETKEELEKANLAKSVFLSNMSHELRTPLNAILGYAQIFADDQTLNEKQQSGIKTIHDAGNHLLMLINDILDLSKIEAGKLELFTQHVVLKKFLLSLCDIIRNRCAQKKILFRYEPDKDLPDIIVVDEVRLRQILLNLLSNAAKFTDKGYCLFAVKAESLAKEKTRLTFIVEDSGPGIAKESQKEAFEPFKQLGERLKYAEGTGLGLSISLQLATLMDGTLSLISPVHEDDVPEYGSGSRFVFTTIVETCAMHSHEKHLEPDAVYRLGEFEPGAKTILIVDDRPSNRAVLKDTLEPLGFIINEAADGKDVQAACERQQPDLILMDLVMPGVDGFTAIRDLQKTDQYAQIPVVAVTASLINQASLKQRCKKVGFKGFLPKPFPKPELLKILADLLNLNLYQGTLTAPVDEKIVIPPSEIIDQLQNHLADGNIEKIESMAADIASMDSGQYSTFARHLGQLAADIQLTKIEQLLDQSSEDI